MPTRPAPGRAVTVTVTVTRKPCEARLRTHRRWPHAAGVRAPANPGV